MGAIQLVTGWIQRVFGSKIADFTPVDKVTPSQMGYYFEHEELKRLMYRLRGFAVVEFTDLKNNPITPIRDKLRQSVFCQ